MTLSIVLLSGYAIIFFVRSMGGPPILIIAMGFQFIQASIRALQAAIVGEPVNSFAAFGVDIEPAIIFASIALAVLAFGIWLTGRGNSTSDREIPSATTDASKMLILSITALIGGHVLAFVQFAIPPAQQLLQGLASLRHVGLFILIYLAIKQGKVQALALGIVMAELILSVMGFFGGFRLVFYVIFGAVLASYKRLNTRMVVSALFVTLSALSMAIFWSHAKVGYRIFLNQGTDAQVTLVPVSERINYLASAFMTFGSTEFQDGLERLLNRITYVDHLAVVMTRVPSVIPHAEGERMGAALMHVFVPRLIFPSKPPLENDTVATNFYTGLHDNWSDGTSISMGYLAEIYIDVGIGGALFIMFLVGLVYGFFFRSLREFSKFPPVLNQALCMMVVLPFSVFETALVKLIGSLIVTFASAFVLQRLVIPILLDRIR